ncbi:MAG TPA: hypothetical protein DDY78_12805 [Planctomycetales bacterium]|jgi:hypothetical protein|nr:hypothetical protein [Planctomycetales bacterium]
MRLLSRFAAGLSLVALFAASALADTPSSPLSFVPDSADLLVQIKSPRRLVETLTNLDAVKELQQFPSIKELLKSTTYRRYYQFLAYFEKELGADRFELLDRLAGGGAVLATKFGDKAPALLVVQGKDEKLMKKFVAAALEMIDQELARQDVKERPVKETYQGVETIRFGKDACAAVVGSTLIVSNNPKALQGALDLFAGKSKKSMAAVASVADAAALLPAEPLASLWINMEGVKQQPGFKEFYTTPRDMLQLLLYGALVDTLGRSPFVSIGLCQDQEGLRLSGRLPRGRDGMGAVQTVFLPPEGQPGTRPPLAPKGVLYSESFYLDPAAIWTDRAKLVNSQLVKSMEETDKNTGKFLSGLRISTLLTDAGPYQRFVAAEQPTAGYKIVPAQHVPAFAVVSEMRNPETLGRNLETALRGAALLATTQVKLKMNEEKYKDCDIVSYRFPEDAPYKGDDGGYRFNFSPSFTRVGNQFVASSTTELCRELVDELQKETKQSPGGAATTQARLVPSGLADLVKAFEGTLVTQTILDQAVPPDAARKQVEAFIQWVRGVGEVNLDETYTTNEFQFDLRWKTGK